MSSFKSALSVMFGFESGVDRRVYAVYGLGLALLKYLGDSLLYFIDTGEIYSVLRFLSPMASQKFAGSDDSAMGMSLMFLAMLWALPFMWIGVSMSIRRAVVCW